MNATYTHLANLTQEIRPPEKGILSRTVFNDDRIKAVLFGFALGEELSEHTASVPAIIQVLEGEAALTLGADQQTAVVGTWVHMPAGLKHSVRAIRPVVMLLLMLKN